MTPEERARQIIEAWQKNGLLPVTIGPAWCAGLVNDFREAERLALERAAQILEKRAALFMVTPGAIYNAHLMSVELIAGAKRVRALSNPSPPAEKTEKEGI